MKKVSIAVILFACALLAGAAALPEPASYGVMLGGLGMLGLLGRRDAGARALAYARRFRSAAS
jgi:hypothetical protein